MIGRIRNNSPARNVLMEAPAAVVAFIRYYLRVNDKRRNWAPLVVIHLDEYEAVTGRAVVLHDSDLYEFEIPDGYDDAEFDELIRVFDNTFLEDRCFIFDHDWNPDPTREED